MQEELLQQAARALAHDELVVFPTETVYGIGASARCPDAVRRVYAIKQRPLDRALIVHVQGEGALDAFAREVPDWARQLAKVFWPGPLTLVLPRRDSLSTVITGGGDTVGVRAPDHVVTQALLAALTREEGAPAGIAGPSANPHGAPSPTSLEDLRRQWGEQLLEAGVRLVDGGRCALGIESTVLLATGDRPKVLRAGAVSAQSIAAASGLEVDNPGGSVTPGKLALAARVRGYRAEAVASLPLSADSGVIARVAPPQACPTPHWCTLPADDGGFARELFTSLQQLERAGCSEIFVERAQGNGGLAPAINARIDRWEGQD